MSAKQVISGTYMVLSPIEEFVLTWRLPEVCGLCGGCVIQPPDMILTNKKYLASSFFSALPTK